MRSTLNITRPKQYVWHFLHPHIVVCGDKARPVIKDKYNFDEIIFTGCTVILTGAPSDKSVVEMMTFPF